MSVQARYGLRGRGGEQVCSVMNAPPTVRETRGPCIRAKAPSPVTAGAQAGTLVRSPGQLGEVRNPLRCCPAG